ncbi:hypothetical protein GCM10007978_41670 [Shewanella hanedai]|uniref:Uncharacterized protein n=1 Tax=Shewanella hanedai TaxID=25 RepID=A0A553JIG8_SHEHA|nr:hypothetical protein [Shewanella hanedai]TRY12242.1 hypothetical protein FN961_21605 [Shewanella hanedai]GGI99536.1 hypothetical protein GCM10007978_41670 [Shewanella hanedai]
MQKNVWNIFCCVGSTKTNNFPVKRPVRYPYLSFEELYYVHLTMFWKLAVISTPADLLEGYLFDLSIRYDPFVSLN